jgi:hypothetical protein
MIEFHGKTYTTFFFKPSPNPTKKNKHPHFLAIFEAKKKSHPMKKT